MGPVERLLWVAAGTVAATPLALRLTKADERSLRGVQQAAFQPAASCAVAAVLGTAATLAADPGSRRAGPWLVAGALLTASVAATRPPRTSLPARAGTGPELSLVTLNIERDSADAPEIAHRLVALDTDVVALLEYTPATAAACRAAGLHDAYRSVVEHLDEGYFGAAVFSRHEIVGWRVEQLGRRSMVVADLDVGGTRCTVVPVHTQAPIYRRDVVPWRTAFDELGDLVERRSGPVVLAGDWNAVLGHAPFSRLLRRHRLVDAHCAAGWRWPRTWPTNHHLLPPLVCLDHVIVSSDVEVAHVAHHHMPGTDHLAVTAGLRLRSPSEPAGRYGPGASRT